MRRGYLLGSPAAMRMERLDEPDERVPFDEDDEPTSPGVDVLRFERPARVAEVVTVEKVVQP